MKDVYLELLQALRQSSMTFFRRISMGRHLGRLSISEMLSLYLIEMLEGPTLKQFSESMGISQPNATYKVNSLVEKGYVEKRLSRTDRRETNLYTTRKAKKLIKDGEYDSDSLERKLLERYTEQQLQTAGEVFHTIMELLEDGKE